MKYCVAGLLLGVITMVALTPVAVVGQTSTTTTYSPPRTPDGHPDLQGVWQALNTAAEDLEAHSGSLGVLPGQGVVEGGVIPYKPEALAKKKENFEKRATLDPESRCWLPGVPRATYGSGPFQIVQQADKINVMYQYRSAIRYIYTNGNAHPRGPIDWWLGDSRGRWEGNSLVVDVVHFNDQTWFDRAGNFHSEDLHVVERYTPTSPDHMRYEATIEDPKVFTRPWKISMTLYRLQGTDAELLDYACPAFLLEREWNNPASTYFK